MYAIRSYYGHHARPDYITFSGSGEPTLNSKIGDVIRFLKDRVPDVPVAVLTNSTLFSQKQVRSDIKNALVVIPSLDAATRITSYNVCYTKLLRFT